MNEIKAMNQELVGSVELEEMISELVDREEFVCTGDVCGAQAVGW